MARVKLVNISDPRHHEALADILLRGGIVGAIWGHHLYFLACNAFNVKAVRKMNSIKGRPVNQVFACPGAVEEAEEFADIKKSKGLVFAARKIGMKPLPYLEYLYKKLPIAVELYANPKAPSTITFATRDGHTIWIAGHMGDKNYSKLLDTVRLMRRQGKKVVFAGTSLNIKGENTLTVREFEKVIEEFGDKIDAVAVHPGASQLKKLRYSTSSSAVTFIGNKPKLLRLGSCSITTLKKYIPELVIPKDLQYTRR